jgi:hypothetical protein
MVIALFAGGCSQHGDFYSHRQLAFEPLGGARAGLVGRWRAQNGRALVLSGSGRYTYAGNASCWDADGRRLFLLWGCANYGAEEGGVILAVAEAHGECAYVLGEVLRLTNCPEAGEYRR